MQCYYSSMLWFQHWLGESAVWDKAWVNNYKSLYQSFATKKPGSTKNALLTIHQLPLSNLPHSYWFCVNIMMFTYGIDDMNVYDSTILTISGFFHFSFKILHRWLAHSMLPFVLQCMQQEIRKLELVTIRLFTLSQTLHTESTENINHWYAS